MTDYQMLFDKLQTIKYPNTDKVVMIPIPYKDNEGQFKVLELGFFPAGRGTYNKSDENISNKEIMILGQDFDCTKNYKKTDERGKEDIEGNATWSNLLSFLKKVEVNQTNCFFTNAIMGVRKGDIGTGKSPAFKDVDFIKQCQELFLTQLKIQEPNAIFVLGKYVAEFLAPLESKCGNKLTSWSRIKNFAEVDEAEAYSKTEVIFRNGIKTNLVLLIHPSLRHANLRHRRLVKDAGNDVEVEMVKDFLESIK